MLLLGLSAIRGQVATAVEPLRIVTLAPNLAELVFAAGAGEQLVGAVAYSDFPPAVAALPRVGDSFRVDYETIRRLEPDVILTWESGTPRDIVARLAELGYRVESLQLRSLEDIALQVERIGRLAGTEAAALREAERYRDAIAKLRERYAGARPVRVFYQISADPYFTVAGGHVITELLGLCGGRNVFGDMPEVAPAVGLEAVLRRDPEVVIASSNGAAPGWEAAWRRWPFVTAVSHDALFMVNADLVDRSTTRIVAGGQALCDVLELARERLPAPAD